VPSGVVDMEGCAVILDSGSDAPFKIRRPDGTEMCIRHVPSLLTPCQAMQILSPGLFLRAGGEKIRAKWIPMLERASSRSKSGQDHDMLLQEWVQKLY
jgi:hypothetical protein